MAKVILRNTKRERRKLRVKGKVFGTKTRPRLSVFRSNKYIYGQIIDDSSGKTLTSVSLNDVKKIHEKVVKSEAAAKVGEVLAKQAIEKNIKTVTLDRNGYKYHGRVKSFSDGLRNGGIDL